MATTSSSTSTSPMNLSGLASGIDTSSIIDQLMSIERQPEIRVKLQQAAEDARQQALRDVQSKLQTLQLAADGLKDPGLWGNQQTVDVNDPTKIAATYVSGTGPGGYTVGISQLARGTQHWYTYAAPAAGGTITALGHSTTITAGSDINAAAQAINGDSGAQVYATVVTDPNSPTTQYLVLSSRTTGQASNFDATGGAGITGEITANAVTGVDANYTVNNVAHTSPSNVVTDGIPGLSLTLKGVTTTSGPVTVNVGQPGINQTAVSDKIKDFVNAYNDAVTFIESKLSETPVFNPQSATDASKGVLHSDSSLESLLSQLRNSVTGTYANDGTGNPNPGTMDQLSQIGVSTGAAVGSGTLNQDAIAGKLTLNADTLTTALTSNPQYVRNLLGGTTGVSGFADAFDSILNPTIQAGGTLDQRIADEDAVKNELADRITSMDAALQQKQDLLKQQFTAMETAMAASQAQGQWLAGQIAGLPAH